MQHKTTLANERETSCMGHELSLFARPGMTICLQGDLGAGKTTLARALIRSLARDPHLEVPSPTFSLVQSYDNIRVPTDHYDLYRLEGVDEIVETGFFDQADDRLALVEWPEKLADDIPDNRIDVHLTTRGDERQCTLTGHGTMAAVVERFVLVSDFIAQSSWHDAERSFLQGDASARRYERLLSPTGERAILMDMPVVPDGPVISNGKTYSQIAHIALDIIPVAAINKGLCDMGYSAPASLDENLPDGLMIIEDFGDEVFGTLMARGTAAHEPLRQTVKLLADMATRQWPSKIQLDETTAHTIPPYDRGAYLAEIDLLPDWFWPMQKHRDISSAERGSFAKSWQPVLALFEADQSVWVMRDLHSPNLIWLPERQSYQRVGLIDTQDCVLGHPAYDLVSLLQDARVDLPAGLEDELFDLYCNERTRADADFDRAGFHAAYCGLGAQRATKILGIFARLFKRDGKPGYLKHIPRVSAALDRNLAHRDLATLADWFSTHLPADARLPTGVK